MATDYHDVAEQDLRIAHETRGLIRAVMVAMGKDESIPRTALQLRLEAAGVPFDLTSLAIDFALEHESELASVSKDALTITGAGREWLETETECARELLDAAGKSDDDAQEDLRTYCSEYDFLGHFSTRLIESRVKIWFELLALVLPRDGSVWERDIRQRLVNAGMAKEAATNMLKMSKWASVVDGVEVLTAGNTAADFERDVGAVPDVMAVDYNTLAMTAQGRKLADLDSARDTRPAKERLGDLVAQDARKDCFIQEMVLAVIAAMPADGETICKKDLIDRLVGMGMTSIQAGIALREAELRAINEDGASAIKYFSANTPVASCEEILGLSAAGLQLIFENRTRITHAAAMGALAEMGMA